MSSTNNPQPQAATSSYLGQASNTVKNTVNKVTGSKDYDNTPEHHKETQPPPSGQYNQTVGSAKQTLGSAIGNDSLRKAGEQQNAEGEEQEARKQAQQWGQGAGDRVTGKVGEFLSGPGFGGSEEERIKAENERRKFKEMHDEGKAQQKEAKKDIEQRWGDEDKERR
ncbi:hypothetical protein AJ79_06011 [Helicocarpus griseus UAMH5409]|uniref:CsbD-like domain-containing protein n=1 Tax=Helicocarpus griseus UAMH5409 TaxID=1447875 RepID=A0A2B7X9J1_9EURO|nr:hypothetical protein AJ79_06011 [Helicocarpus griseus UAMH5409]